MQLFTIGFTQKTAEQFFNLLAEGGVKRIVDIRLNNVSQLAGFAKRDDLRFFLKTILDIDYVHISELAPTKEIMNDFKKKKVDWATYKKHFIGLISRRNIADHLKGRLFDRDCLLCSEARAEYCHRRLVAEFLAKKWGDVDIVHL